MISRLARRYARALLDLAAADGVLDPAGAELGLVNSTFQEPQLVTLIGSPLVDREKRVAIAKNIVGALKLSPLVTKFTCLLAERDRLQALPDIHSAYSAMLDERLGRTRVHARTVSALSADQERDLTALAKRLAGGQDVVMTTTVDPTLLGGVVLDLGGTVYDGSVRTQLTRLSKAMSEGA